MNAGLDRTRQQSDDAGLSGLCRGASDRSVLEIDSVKDLAIDRLAGLEMQTAGPPGKTGCWPIRVKEIDSGR